MNIQSRLTRNAIGSSLVIVVASLSVLGWGAPPSKAQTTECSRSYVEGLTALTDLGAGAESYKGHQGGLYPNGSNVVPNAHLKLGLEKAAAVQPRDKQGQPDPSGAIGLVAIGVSNTAGEFRALMERVAPGDPEMADHIVLVNGAQGGAVVDAWIAPDKHAWGEVFEEVAESGLTPAQVQVAWLKVPERNPDEPFPTDAETYAEDFIQVVRSLKANYPNLQLAYLSSRIYGGYGSELNPEPWAYQHGFGVKWTIAEQIDGTSLNADPGAGEVVAPWIGWGPYMWANGLGQDQKVGGVPGRSDGLEWLCEDFRDDGIHPSDEGALKVANMLIDHFKSDPTSCTWFLADPCSDVSQPSGISPGVSFQDIADSVFHDDILWLADAGITKGCNPPDNDLFCPGDFVTRGQMAAFLDRALGLEDGPDAFDDDDDSIFEENIDALAAAGITEGCDPPTNDRFCPTGFVTRGQMAAFLDRTFDLTDGPDVFTDDETSIFEGHINSLARTGITKGCNPPAGDRFCPDGLVTRGQMAAFLHRAEPFLP